MREVAEGASPGLAILCAVSASARAARVAKAARRLAAALDASVVLTHVFDPMMVPAAPTRDLGRLLTTEEIEEHERGLALDALADASDPGAGVPETIVLAEGEPLAELLRLQQAHDARLLVTGSAARSSVERILQGSISADLVRQAPCPVVIVTDDMRLPDPGPVVAGFDGSEDSLRAARHAAAFAAALRQELVLVHVVAPGETGVRPDEELARELDEAARACTAAATPEPGEPSFEVVVAHGDPSELLIEAADARGASLVVVGNRGRGALTAAILGSVSAGVVRRSDRLVVVAGPLSEQAGS
jgi:nucleotide-binding universal stress UspA family protein